MAVGLFRSIMPGLPLLCLPRVVGPCPLPVAHPQPGGPLWRDDAHRVRGAPPCREPPFLGRKDAKRDGLSDGVLHRRAGNARQRCDVADGEAAQASARHLGGDRRQDGRLGHGEARGELRRQPACQSALKVDPLSASNIGSGANLIPLANSQRGIVTGQGRRDSLASEAGRQPIPPPSGRTACR